MRIAADFSEETLKAKRTWNDLFQFLKENNCWCRLMYPAIEGEIKISTTNKN
jgi:hypothetical protein